MTQKPKERVLARGVGPGRIDIISQLPGVAPKTVVGRGRVELGPEHFEGYHYKDLVTNGLIREVKRFVPVEPPPKPVATFKPKTKPVKAKKTEKGQDSLLVESGEESFINLSGDPASDQKDGV